MSSYELIVHEDSENYKEFLFENRNDSNCIKSLIKTNGNSSEEFFFNGLMKSDIDKTSIFIYKNVIFGLSKEKLSGFLEYVSNKLEFDFIYLTRYSDKILKNKTISCNDGIFFQKTVSANGIEAFIITPKIKKILIDNINFFHGRGFNFLLKSLSEKYNFLATYPCIYYPDLSKLKDEKEIIRLNVSCDSEFLPDNKEQRKALFNPVMNLIYFLFIIFMVLFCTFLGIHYFSDSGKISLNDAKTGIGPEDPTGDLKTFRYN